MSKLDNLKRSIKTICQQFPKFILNFDLAERELINEFLTVIGHFEEADNKRETLSKRFDEYSGRVTKNDLYLRTPFLWLTVCIAENTVYHLSISRFYATEFYKFLLYQLRNLYPLIKRGVQLSAFDYEQLQIKCDEPNFILSSDEIEVLKTTYTSLEKSGLDSLGSKAIKDEINRNMLIPRKYKTHSELLRFYTLVGGKWWLQFHPAAIGLSRVFFHIHLSKNIELNQIIDFTDPDNMVLGLSNVHQVGTSKTEYIGTLLIPTRDIDNLYTYFKLCEYKNNLKIKKFDLLDKIQRSSAFTLYKPNLGWQKLPTKERHAIARIFHSDSVVEALNHDLYFQNPPLTSNQWSFTQHPLPEEIIELICRISFQFSFSHLLYDDIFKEKDKHHSLRDIEQLRKLHDKKVLEIGFTPWRLIYNHSVKRYCIKLPNVTLEKLKYLLNILPYAETYFSQDQIYIWTRLRDEDVAWMKNQFKGILVPVVRVHSISTLDFEWFDRENLQWISPKILHNPPSD